MPSNSDPADVSFIEKTGLMAVFDSYISAQLAVSGGEKKGPFGAANANAVADPVEMMLQHLQRESLKRLGFAPRRMIDTNEVPLLNRRAAVCVNLSNDHRTLLQKRVDAAVKTIKKCQQQNCRVLLLPYDARCEGCAVGFELLDAHLKKEVRMNLNVLPSYKDVVTLDFDNLNHTEVLSVPNLYDVPEDNLDDTTVAENDRTGFLRHVLAFPDVFIFCSLTNFLKPNRVCCTALPRAVDDVVAGFGAVEDFKYLGGILTGDPFMSFAASGGTNSSEEGTAMELKSKPRVLFLGGDLGVPLPAEPSSPVSTATTPAPTPMKGEQSDSGAQGGQQRESQEMEITSDLLPLLRNGFPNLVNLFDVVVLGGSAALVAQRALNTMQGKQYSNNKNGGGVTEYATYRDADVQAAVELLDLCERHGVSVMLPQDYIVYKNRPPLKNKAFNDQASAMEALTTTLGATAASQLGAALLHSPPRNRKPKLSVVQVDEPVPPKFRVLDIGPKSVREIHELLSGAATCLCLGAPGDYEIHRGGAGVPEDVGTVATQAILSSMTSSLHSVLIGEKLVDAAQRLGCEGNVTHCSSAGEKLIASLLQGIPLAGLLDLPGIKPQ